MTKMVARFRGVSRREKEENLNESDAATAATQEDDKETIILNNPTLKYL